MMTELALEQVPEELASDHDFSSSFQLTYDVVVQSSKDPFSIFVCDLLNTLLPLLSFFQVISKNIFSGDQRLIFWFDKLELTR